MCISSCTLCEVYNPVLTNCTMCIANNTRDCQVFTYHTVRGIQPCVNKVTQCALPTTHVIVDYLLVTLYKVYNPVLTNCTMCIANNTRDCQVFTYHTVRGIQLCVNKVTQCALPTTHVIVNYLLYHTVRCIQPCINKAAQYALPTTHVIVDYLLYHTIRGI